MNSAECGCGYSFPPSRVGGLPGLACPNCGAFFGNERDLSPEQTQKLVAMQQSAAREAMRISPRGTLLIWIAINICFFLFPAFFLHLFHFEERAVIAPLVWLICFDIAVVGISWYCWGASIMRFQDYTGYEYVRDRAAVGRAGAYDVAQVSPVVTFLALTALFALTPFPSAEEWPMIKRLIPWAFIVFFNLFAVLCMWLLTGIVFRIRCSSLPKQKSSVILW